MLNTIPTPRIIAACACLALSMTNAFGHERGAGSIAVESASIRAAAAVDVAELAAEDAAVLSFPGALAMAPMDAPLVITLRNPRATLDRLNRFLTDMPSDGVRQVQAGLSAAMLAMFLPGMDATDSFALAIYPPAPGADGLPDPDAFPEVLVIAPVTSFKALTNGLRLQERDGVAVLDLGQLMGGGGGAGGGGMSGLVVRDIPGPYVAAAMNPDTLARFAAGLEAQAAGAGAGAAAGGGWMARMTGPAAAAVSASDLAVLANPEAVREAFAGLGGIGALMGGGGGGMAGMAGGAAMDAITPFIDALSSDGELAVFGMTLTDDDFVIELGGQFKEGSATSELLSDGPVAGDDQGDERAQAAAMPMSATSAMDALSWLPDERFLVVAGADLTHAPTQRVMSDWLGSVADANPFLAAMMPASTVGTFPRGHSVMIGLSPAALGGAGILGQSVAVTRSVDAAQAGAEYDARRARLAAYEGASEGALAMDFTIEPSDAVKSADRAEAYRVRATRGGDAASNGAADEQLMNAQRMYGRAGGPGGVIVRRGDAVVISTGRSSSFLDATMTAVGRGAGEGGVAAAPGMLSERERALLGSLPVGSGMMLAANLDSARSVVGDLANIFLAKYGGPNAELGTLVGGLSLGEGGARAQVRMARPTAVILLDLLIGPMLGQFP